MSFSVISQKFLIFWWLSNNSLFLTTWPRKRTPQKHYKNRGFGTPIFEKELCVTKRPSLDKKTQIQKFQLSFFFAIFFSFNNKNTTNCWTPYCYSVLANLKKDNFQNLNLKHWKLKNPIFAPFFRKRLFLENCKIIGHKKKHKMITEQKKIAWNPYFYSVKTNLAHIITLAWPRK